MSRKFLPKEYPKRILMLVAYEPELDPRVNSIIRLCAPIGRIDVLGFVTTTQKPLREYDQKVYLERVLVGLYPLPRFIQLWRKFADSLSRLSYYIHHSAYVVVSSLPQGREFIAKVKRVKERIRTQLDKMISKQLLLADSKNAPAKKPEDLILGSEFKSSTLTSPLSESDTERKPEILVGGNQLYVREATTNPIRLIQNVWNTFYIQKIIANALFQRARGSSIIPKLIICHDLQTLEAGVKLKKKFHSSLVYDYHGLSPQADSLITQLEKHLLRMREQHLIKFADLVTTTEPEIAIQLQKLYYIHNVIAIPDTKPFLYTQAVQQLLEV